MKPPLSKDVRFKTSDQIIAAIDKTVARVEKLRNDATGLDKKADEIYRKLRVEELEEYVAYSPVAQDYRERAGRKRAKAEHIRMNYLHRLKNKLAVMQTKIMPAIVEDESIPQ